jgi:prepilin-type N-terminal cleavage/methylation domain-containing protein
LQNRGFTLLEVLVTLAVVGVGVLVLARMQIVAIRGTGFNKEANAAAAVAQTVLEDCKAAVFGTRPASCNRDEGGMATACDMRVAGDAPYRSNNIEVMVTWGSPRNEVRLSTIVAER